jgi:hypothetical protein
MKEFKERLVGLNEQQRKLARVIRGRVELRMVQCAVLFHAPLEGVKRIVRMDTGEVVREEPMTDSEKQLNLFAAQSEFERFTKGHGVDQPGAPDEAKDEEETPDEDQVFFDGSLQG